MPTSLQTLRAITKVMHTPKLVPSNVSSTITRAKSGIFSVATNVSNESPSILALHSTTAEKRLYVHPSLQQQFSQLMQNNQEGAMKPPVATPTRNAPPLNPHELRPAIQDGNNQPSEIQSKIENKSEPIQVQNTVTDKDVNTAKTPLKRPGITPRRFAYNADWGLGSDPKRYRAWGGVRGSATREPLV